MFLAGRGEIRKAEAAKPTHSDEAQAEPGQEPLTTIRVITKDFG
jgi:hypothetical protein